MSCLKFAAFYPDCKKILIMTLSHVAKIVKRSVLSAYTI